MSEQRTEQATPRRLEKAREDGQFPASKDFVSAVQYLGVLLILSAWGATWFRETQHDFRRLLTRAFTPEMDPAAGVALAKEALSRAFLPLGIAAGVLVVITLLAQLVSTNMGISFKRLAPSGARFNPLNRLKDLPKQNMPAALQALALMVVMGYIVYLLIRDSLPSLLVLPLSTVH